MPSFTLYLTVENARNPARNILKRPIPAYSYNALLIIRITLHFPPYCRAGNQNSTFCKVASPNKMKVWLTYSEHEAKYSQPFCLWSCITWTIIISVVMYNMQLKPKGQWLTLHGYIPCTQWVIGLYRISLNTAQVSLPIQIEKFKSFKSRFQPSISLNPGDYGPWN